MAIEIEKKFLLRNDGWRKQSDAGTAFKQGYLIGSDKTSVRVRIEGEQANINIKSATLGITRQEFEYAIPMDDAEELLESLCEKPLIEKTRYHITQDNHLWEIDVFEGDNAGLIVAEIELGSENEAFTTPDWLGIEVSDDSRYYNVCLLNHPFCNW